MHVTKDSKIAKGVIDDQVVAGNRHIDATTGGKRLLLIIHFVAAAHKEPVIKGVLGAEVQPLVGIRWVVEIGCNQQKVIFLPEEFHRKADAKVQWQ